MQRRFVKVEGQEGLIRDMETQAVLPTDISIVRKHEARVIELMKNAQREEEIAAIKKDVLEIKEMLGELCNGIQHNIETKIKKRKGNR